MRKLKTNKAIRSRFKVTGTGKVLALKTKRRHLLADRPPARKRRNRRKWVMGTVDRKTVLKALPYGAK